MTVEEIKKELPAIKQKIESGEYKVVSIDGPQGPTGKTTAANFLRSEGVPVFEEWQMFNIQIGWAPKAKTSIMMWPQFVHDAGEICDMIHKCHHGYQAIIVGGTHRVDEALDILRSNRVPAFKESEVLRFTLSTYVDYTSRENFHLH